MNHTTDPNMLPVLAERDKLRAEVEGLRAQVEELDDRNRNRWRWPNERDRRLKADAEVEQLRAALTTLLRFARPVDIQACLIQGGVDVEAAVRG